MILLNKSKYLTSFEAIQKLRKENVKYANSKLGYAGTLDPMATGLLLILENDENKDRKNYIGLTKVYEFEILFGISTDTYDLLGVITQIEKENNKKLNNLDLNQFVGEYNQKFPPFSAKIVAGKRLYKHSRENNINDNQLPTYLRNVKKLELLDSYHINKSELLTNVKLATEAVKGDFRQKEILKTWLTNNDKIEDNYKIFKIRAEVSSGTYIRRLCVDIALRYNTCALAYSINRIKVGDFDVKDSI